MKRSAKILIAASAVAAAFGVGTVSYALWTAGGSTPVKAEGSAGMVKTVGNVTVSSDQSTGKNSSGNLVMKKLLPYDHEYVDGPNFWQFAVSVQNSAGDVQVTLEGSIDCNAAVAKLYYSQTAPGSIATTDELSSVKTIDVSKPVYVYMIASSSVAMNASISLTFTAKAT